MKSEQSESEIQALAARKVQESLNPAKPVAPGPNGGGKARKKAAEDLRRSLLAEPNVAEKREETIPVVQAFVEAAIQQRTGVNLDDLPEMPDGITDGVSLRGVLRVLDEDLGDLNKRLVGLPHGHVNRRPLELAYATLIGVRRKVEAGCR